MLDVVGTAAVRGEATGASGGDNDDDEDAEEAEADGALARWCGQDVVAEPDRVGSELAVQSAVFFWERNALNDLADIDDLKAITRRINGGLNGFADRRELLEKGRHALRELGLAGSVAPASVPFAPTHRVVPLQLNLRSAPRVSPATLLASLAQGTEVEVRGPASAAIRPPTPGRSRRGIGGRR